MCKKDVGIVMPNFAALRAAVFQLSTKNLRGGRISAPPPSVRGLKLTFTTRRTPHYTGTFESDKVTDMRMIKVVLPKVKK